jgi:hypothetical protein
MARPGFDTPRFVVHSTNLPNDADIPSIFDFPFLDTTATGALPTLLGETLGRPARVVIPDDYDPSGTKAYPLVMVLHGYGSTGDYHDFYMWVEWW